MPKDLSKLQIDLIQVQQIAEAAKVSITELSRALQEMSKSAQGIKEIRVFGATEADLRRLHAQIPQIAQAYIQTVAELQAAQRGEQATVRVTQAAYDAYTGQLKLAAEARRQLTIATTTGEGFITLPIITPLPEQVVPIGAGREFNAVQQEMIDKLGGGAKGLQRATEASEKYGMTLNNLNRAHLDAVNGVTRFSLTLDHGGGVTRDATIYVDRLGKILGDTSTRFRSTTAMIERNVGKVMEWAVAVGVVYGAIRKLNQVMEDMRDIEYIFADIAIVTGETGEALYAYADAAHDVALETGITFKEVLSIYDDVFRATANITDEAERLTVANTLLRDSVMMAKLANVDATQGYDMMLGALRQAGLELDQGTVLLDKWVAVSKEAGVSVEDMAQSFAIGADIMRAAGVDIDHFNGLIATLQESTTLSATQVGNALRAMASTYTTERSITVLNKYGVSVKDLSGEYRSLWEVLQQVAAMYETGVLSESQTKAIAEAMGGGQRRAAQVMTVITNLGKVHESTAVSINAHGDAEEALAIKTNTLQTALNDLTTAWQGLAMTMGVEGGVLDMLTDLTDIMSRFVGFVGDTTEALGPLTASLIEFLAVYSMFGFVSGMQRVGGISARIGDISRLRPGYEVLPGSEGLPSGVRYRETTPSGAFPGAKGRLVSAEEAMRSPQLLGAVGWLRDPRNLVGVFSTAAIAAAPLLTKGITDESVAETAGGAIGAAFGWAITGSPVGGMIGATIGQALMETVIKQRHLLTTPLAELTTEQLEERLAFRELRVGRFGRVFEDEIETIKEILNARQTAVKEELDIEENLYIDLMEEVKAIEQQYISDLPTIHQTKLEALKEYSFGNITRKEYTDAVAAAENGTAIIYQFWRHMAGEMGNDIQEVYDVFLGASQETLQEVMANTAELNRLEVERKKLITEIAEAQAVYPRRLDELNTALSRTELEYDRIIEQNKLLLELMEREAAPALPEYMKLDVSTSELAAYIEEAKRMMVEFAAFAGIALEGLFEDSIYYAFTSDEVWNKITPDVNKTFLQWAISAGEAFSQHFNLERLKDVSPEKFPDIVQRTRYWEEMFRRIGKPFEQEPITMILGPSNEVRTLTASTDALRYALDDLREVEEKRMLEGMWNIPAGATFYVPITSLFYQRMQKQEEGGAMPGLPPYGSGAGMAGAIGASRSIADLGRESDTASTSLYRLALISGEVVRKFNEVLAPYGLIANKPYTEFTEERRRMMDRVFETPWEQIFKETFGTMPSAAPTEVQVEIPPISAKFEIENKVFLDGKQIKDYVSYALAEDLRRDIRGGVNPAAANAPITGWFA